MLRTGFAQFVTLRKEMLFNCVSGICSIIFYKQWGIETLKNSIPNNRIVKPPLAQRSEEQGNLKCKTALFIPLLLYRVT